MALQTLPKNGNKIDRSSFVSPATVLIDRIHVAYAVILNARAYLGPVYLEAGPWIGGVPQSGGYTQLLT